MTTRYQESSTFLQRAYALSDAPGARSLYDEWADSYDADLKNQRYASPQRAVDAILAEVDINGEGKLTVLDAGCGTGLVGQILAETSLAPRLIIDGNDLSPGMLAIARQKHVYRNLNAVDLSKPLSLEDASYDVVSCVGTLTKGHVGPSVFSEFARVAKAGGIIAATVHGEIWKSHGYAKVVDDLAEAGQIKIVQTADIGILEDTTSGAIMVVLRKL